MDILDPRRRQENFPHEDLTPENADFLSLVLANEAALNDGHNLANLTHFIFKKTHPALVAAAGHLFFDPKEVAAINFGITAYEATTLYIAAELQMPKPEELAFNTAFMMGDGNIDGKWKFFQEAQEELRGDRERLADVIAESAASRYKSLSYLAVVGCAIAYKFEDYTTEGTIVNKD